MAKPSLTPGRDKRVEELERRLKSMEKMLKSRGSNSQPTSNDLDFGENSGRLDPHSSNQSELTLPNSASCSDMASTVSSEKTRAWSLPSSGGKTENVLRSTHLIAARLS